jgi:hypothetical protein
VISVARYINFTKNVFFSAENSIILSPTVDVAQTVWIWTPDTLEKKLDIQRHLLRIKKLHQWTPNPGGLLVKFVGNPSGKILKPWGQRRVYL